MINAFIVHGVIVIASYQSILMETPDCRRRISKWKHKGKKTSTRLLARKGYSQMPRAAQKEQIDIHEIVSGKGWSFKITVVSAIGLGFFFS
jgi:hypothetical protein